MFMLRLKELMDNLEEYKKEHGNGNGNHDLYIIMIGNGDH